MEASALNTVRMLRTYPEAARQMPTWQQPSERVLRRRGAYLAWQAPALGRAVVPVLLLVAEALDALDLERSWRRVHQVLFDYCHWAGIREVVDDIARWERLRAGREAG
jgi:hypothetical protein